MNNQRNENKEVLDFFQKELNATTSLRNEINKDYAGLQIDIIKQRRDLFYKIAVLSGAILGITKFFTHPQNQNYFLVGVILFLFLIIFILFYIRESLDRDSNGLRRQQDNYNTILEEKVGLLEKYLTNAIFTKEKIKSYFKELESSEAYKLIKKENESLSKERKNRLEGKEFLEFTSEFVLFLFTTASFFIFISLVKPQLSWMWLLASILFIACLTFLDITKPIVRFISKPLNFLKRKRIIKKD